MTKNTPRILVTAPMDYVPPAKAMLEEVAEVTYRERPAHAELVRIIGGYDVIVTDLGQVVDRAVIDAGARLRMIVTPSTGTDHLDIPYAESKGIVVQSSKRDYHVLKTITATAEHAFLLMLCCLRWLPFAFDGVRRGEWERAPYHGREAQGRVYGIVGYGRLGEMVSRYAHAFDMPVIACDPNKTIADPWVRQVDFETLLREAEIISLHVHLTPETTHLVGDPELALMRDGVYLVNTSRGRLIDEAALVRALESGKVAAAAVDVIATELDSVIGDNPLVQYARAHSNLIITPHMGGFTLDSQLKAYRNMAEKLIAELKRLGFAV